MLNSIIRFSIRNKVVVLLGTLALIAWGLWSATKIPIDAVPDITNNQVQIITVSPTLAGQEVEQFVTYPIEQALANLPDVLEMRSISRFGLSVVTVVFDDRVNIWFARQLVGEKLREAEDQIPPEAGMPELAPVSTGLGEIYQYVIHPKAGSEDKYSAMDLRTMQDWIVARQLYGTPGVAEVNGFGGMVKQYEVAVNPDRLRAMNITIAEIFSALRDNNENTGGAYIDKKPHAYFIRGLGLVKSLDDIRDIVVKTRDNGIPVLIGDIATVRFGSAVRYGALTFNGEKEAVGGMVMMLKGANSAAVVSRVKEKMETIRKSLPDDVVIEPFLDRTNLVERAIQTVQTNLVEGALIVIFVLVIFLGNLRSGLVVASAIPLSMLFALGMMHVFGVSANLMSLGALDFGLIVDGAVIIVEAAMHAIGMRRAPGDTHVMTAGEMDQIVEDSSKRMMNSATFGQIIILIVYLPILSLQGIEGKMFGPMAQTVSFAILGAIILSLTYIPVMSALALPRKFKAGPNFSDRFIGFLQRLYRPTIAFAIHFKALVISAAVLLFAGSLLLFSRLGGEFIPQLEEGDYAFHCILPMGSSLSQSVETSMQAMRLIKTFPEVKMVVGKTGSAEVPTDPMPPEATDMMIILKDKTEWTTTQDYNALAQLMMEKLEVIPGIVFESNQPIQMRFNELMTGIRQDVAVKIFGENIDTLAALAPYVARIVEGVMGTSAPQIEQTVGLPQITIDYDRNRLANYGINIEVVNHTVSTAFAGEKAGVVFEDERKYDLVVRLDSSYRTSIDNVSDLLIPTPNGTQIPLHQVAEISFQQGPAQISRDDGRRRIVVGFNVTGRDVRSVVDEIRSELDASIVLPTGYYYTFGGTFENLEKANARLKVAVPLALFLIFILLYFTFNSVGQAALIYTAIPMSAIGGVLALFLRDMPFSISAGVGFIALFGVSVLNGIVLIATFNQLKKEGMTSAQDRVVQGTMMRLRPVLMTAAVASLGFLPMALSHGAGAEVQKPLATVVIGGLISSTFLTLVVLPLLYIVFDERSWWRSASGGGKLAGMTVILLAAFIMPARAQDVQRMALPEAIQISLENNLELRAGRIGIEKTRASARGWFDLPRTGMFIENEDFTPEDDNGVWKIGLSQSVGPPGLYKAKQDLLSTQILLQEMEVSMSEAQIIRDVRMAYYSLWYLTSKQQLLKTLDSLYSGLAAAAGVRFSAGESTSLEQLSAEARSLEVQMQTRQVQADIAMAQQALMRLLNTDIPMLPEDAPLGKAEINHTTTRSSGHPLLQTQEGMIRMSEADIVMQRKSRAPDYAFRLFSQRLYGISSPVSGFSFTIGIPLFGKSHQSRIEAAYIEKSLQEEILRIKTQQLSTQSRQADQAVYKASEAVQFYERTGLARSSEIIRTATLAYRAGDISFADLSLFVTQATDLRLHHLDALHAYNMAAVEYQYYLNN